MLGKLSLDALPHDMIQGGAAMQVVMGALTVIAAITFFKKWTWLYENWLTTVDHKKIGIMYIVVALTMLLRGFADAGMMRFQLMIAQGDMAGILPPDHYNQIFTAHGVIMIFFVAMPLMTGLFNLVIPLQIGARDVAFPFFNSLSFWLYVAGVMLTNVSLVVGEYAATGWLAYPPLSGADYSPGVGVDYYIWAIQIAGIGTLLSGVNFFVTIIKMRAPGMTLMKMPIFVWTALSSNILILFAFPILAATLGMLSLDRFFDFHFFTSDLGGSAMMYINLIWVWGHPEVYILILPAFGIFSEVAAVFAQKKLFGYTSMVYATAVITFLSMIVWVHHFFTMGAGGNVNAVFGIATMIIAVPTGAKIFTWLFTLYRGKILFTTPVFWLIGFLLTFTVGGMTGVMLSVPPADFQYHNSMFLVAHFHNTIIGGVVFGYMAGLHYWFPKVMGFKLNERLGKLSALHWIVGFFVAFVPMYIVGLMGATRRISHYDDPAFQPFFAVAFIGVIIIGGGIFFTLAQIAYSFWKKEETPDVDGDPWNGRTLEWSIPSPAPFYNFAKIPQVTERDDLWERKTNENHPMNQEIPYEEIHMPHSTSLGMWLGVVSGVFGFAMVWHIHWLTVASLLVTVALVFIRSLNHDLEYSISAEEVEKMDKEFTKGARL